jgi:hypothetical protein
MPTRRPIEEGYAHNKEKRPRYVVTLEPLPHVDPIKSLRATLKGLLRRAGMKCTDIHEEPRS